MFSFAAAAPFLLVPLSLSTFVVVLVVVVGFVSGFISLAFFRFGLSCSLNFSFSHFLRVTARPLGGRLFCDLRPWRPTEPNGPKKHPVYLDKIRSNPMKASGN